MRKVLGLAVGAAIVLSGSQAMAGWRESVFYPTGLKIENPKVEATWGKRSYKVTSKVKTNTCPLKAESDINWRAALPDAPVVKSNSDAPWSVATIVLDSFNGDQDAIVQDKSFDGGLLSESGVMSIFSATTAAFLAYYADAEDALSARAVKAQFRVHGQFYTMTKEIPTDLAQALMESDGNIAVRITLPSGRTRDFEIGAKTIESWKKLRKQLTSC